ncbi:MAG: hypothetical protein JXJ04_11975 [Spirochaetales bacterium]|nr:hypothetical protein [Spirochaetales bacterium]
MKNKKVYLNRMRKNLYFFLFIFLILFCLVLTGCDKKTAILPTQCSKCHSSSFPEYGVLGAKAHYEVSGHNILGNASYSNGDGCQRCHTNEGFIEYKTYGEPKEGSYIKYPSQPGCFTCHQPHETGDFSLRAPGAVTLETKVVFDRGKGNICANCHQARGRAKATVKEMPVKALASYWGAHHGPQADVFMGTNAFEYEGKKYSNGMHTSKVEDGCIACHMTLPEARYSLSAGIGGHSFNIAGDVHESPVLNNAGCLLCHSTRDQVRGKEIFDVKTKDYDTDGTLEPLQEEVEGLLERFVNTNGTGYLQKLNPPMYRPDGSHNWSTDATMRPVPEVAALYNYKFILEDRSKGIHNTNYTIQILYDTISSLDSTFDTSLRPH